MLGKSDSKIKTANGLIKNKKLATFKKIVTSF